ncbi:MAG: Slp family lipoprotein [Thermodesulfovibrionales bacterium]|nr:Slp family lipoprotein [Thermodesulfovibrionales bacterium]
MKRALLILLAATLLASCAPVISNEARMKALRIPFGTVQSDVEKYKDSPFLWGGTIVKATIVNAGTLVEVVQKPVNKYGEIIDKDVSGGRFLGLYSGHLDPQIYRKGRNITVTGRLTGSEERKIGDATYVFPVLEIKELYLWKEEIYYNNPYFYYFYPYPYYPPWHYPYYYPYYPPP